MELDLQSRMYTYETNKAQAIRFVRNISPHIKSYTRLMTAPNDVKTLARSPNAKSNTPDSCSTRMSRQTGCGGGNYDTEGKGQDKGGPKGKEQKKGRDGLKGHLCNCYPLAWSLITSSCLSRGKHSHEHHATDTARYTTLHWR